MLLAARAAGIDLVEVPIETVYLEGNSSSHFRPLADSARIWAPLLRFTASALLAFAVDTVALLVFHALTGWLLFSVVGARVLSASLNYLVNRRHVFAGGRDLPTRATAARYFSLAGVLPAANYGVLSALTDAGISLILAKVLSETTLFAVSFSVQRAVVFAPVRA
jgi:putative flippase GtrA